MQLFQEIVLFASPLPVFATERTLTFTKSAGEFVCFARWCVQKPCECLVRAKEKDCYLLCSPMALNWDLFLLLSNAQLSAQMSFHHPKIALLHPTSLQSWLLSLLHAHSIHPYPELYYACTSLSVCLWAELLLILFKYIFLGPKKFLGHIVSRLINIL